MTKSDNSRSLTERQKQVIPFLVSARSIDEACKQAKISRETVYKWLRKSPVFNRALDEQRDVVLKDALNRLKGIGNKAVDTLAGLLESNLEAIKERAAGRVLDYLLKVKEIESINQRLEVLENNINHNNR